MIKTIIFDYGGVIGHETGECIFKAVSKVYKIGPNRVKKEFYRFSISLQTGTIKEKVFWEKLANNLGIAESNKLKNMWISEHQGHSGISSDGLAIARGLKDHYKLCLLANTILFYKKDSIERRLKRIFSVIIYSYKVGLRKPDREIYDYALKKLKVEPEECIMIDDNEKNLVYPKELRMKVIHFKSFQILKKQLNRSGIVF